MNKGFLFSADEWAVRRADSVAVGPFDLALRDGDIVTWMGPSGVGKTSVLMSLLGYEERSLIVSGTRCEMGRPILPGAVPTDALYIPQHLPFNPNWEVSAFLLRLPWRVARGEAGYGCRRARFDLVMAALKRVGLEGRAHATVAELSGGEVQRAAIAQMLLLRPRLIVADEFVSALDPGMALEILDYVHNAVKQQNGAAMLALHDVHAALHISTRIALLWPPASDMAPWWIQAGSQYWNADSIRSLLCLARWSGGHRAPALQELVHVVRALLDDDSSMDKRVFVGAGRGVVIGDTGSVEAIDVETIADLETCSEFHDDVAMSPIRINKNGRCVVGVAHRLVGDSSAKRCVILARVESGMVSP